MDCWDSVSGVHYFTEAIAIPLVQPQQLAIYLPLRLCEKTVKDIATK